MAKANKKQTERPGAGRPTKYSPEFAKQAAKLCELGATDAELADFFNVSVRSIAGWKTRHSEFLHALNVGKEAADKRVVDSLYHKAVGYSYDAVKIFMPAGAKEPVYAQYREHVPPDTTAMIFWLKNRKPEEWRDRQQHEHTGKDGAAIEQNVALDLAKLTPDEREALRGVLGLRAAKSAGGAQGA